MMTRGEKVITFIEKYCLTPEGEGVGKPLRLAAFQRQFILDVYDNPATTRTAILSVSRKNGKTGLIAGLMLAHIIGPEAVQNSQIISGAMSRDQASLVFALACKMLDLNPSLAGLYRYIPSSKRIIGLRKNVEYRALSAESTTAHGLSPILAILDEVGQVKGPTTPFLDAILTSQGAHANPLTIMISTQSPSDADFLSVRIDDAKRSSDRHTVCHVYEADKDCDLLDEAQWKKANPALGLFRGAKDLEEQLKQAKRIPAMEATARNLLLNQRISLESLWLAPAVWKSCAAIPNIEVFRDGRVVSMGLDLSQKNDLTAAVLAAQDDDGVVHLLPFGFTPEHGLREREQLHRTPYIAWVKSGQLVAVPGKVLDYDWLFEWLSRRISEMGISVDTVQFDRWRIVEAKSAAERAGFYASEWAEVGQGFKDMSPRVELFEGLLLRERIRHGAHPLLNLGAASAVVVRDPAGNKKLDKSRATQKIDALVAAVMAVGAFTVSKDFDATAFIA